MSGPLRRSSRVAVQVSDGVVQVTMSVVADLGCAATLFEACELATGVVRLQLDGSSDSAGVHLCRVVKEADARSKANHGRLLITAADPAIADLLTAAGIVGDPAPAATAGLPKPG